MPVQAVVKTTEGDFTLELYTEQMPITACEYLSPFLGPLRK